MSSSQPETVPRKRQRTDTDAPVETETTSTLLGKYTRDDEFWFDDGTVILEAQGTCFRVYRGWLAKHSDVFSSLFSLPQPADSEHIGDCPVVHVSDRPEELLHLLRALFNVHMFDDHVTPIEFQVVASIVRMCHKYQVQELFGNAMSLLKAYFTDDLDIYCKRLQGESTASPRLSIAAGDAVTAVNLARLTNTDSILPVAMYECCQLGSKAIVEGISRPDGTFEMLQSTDQIRCIDGNMNLVAEHIGGMNGVFKKEAYCRNAYGSCGNMLRELRAGIVRVQGNVWTAVLEPWDGFVPKSLQLCQDCRKSFLADDVARRKKAWGLLPKLMGVNVKGWDSSKAAAPA
ncbi:uncharacterized protein LAESUDRAFT_677176 [Laetiporus sulphureus 93-53]|uniref:BTB domain-containing protein n=1 Tax=Laetiporus sulphureus 93-53 TaxID=1314785 RepID=A0A165EY90_9APHY|nr:uncharacterized protein LAESUDRAFT_677176 [Laetiporus sulphureus 93-53]KZT07969.1 hypothetical protein LAESUDRAFT_677176 [Laetiporus sulphureus 93-53]